MDRPARIKSQVYRTMFHFLATTPPTWQSVPASQAEPEHTRTACMKTQCLMTQYEDTMPHDKI